jgi:predicted acetyltransferase/GNAT superfamily N-acetyltransferase
MTLRISFESNPEPNDIQIIADGIKAYAKKKKALTPWDYFAFFIRDQENNVVGGCDGNELYGCLYIDQLWVSETIRHSGWGTQLINAALDYGKNRGCTFANVDTMDWEALDFYQKLGFTVEFERTGFHKNSVSYALRKELLADPQSKTKVDSTLIADLKILQATLKDYPVIQNMARFYVYDLSRECGFISEDWACPSDGLYECFDFKCYFEDPSRRAYLITVGHELAGFVLLNQEGTSPATNWNVGEFFILAKFQGKGVAQQVAHQIWSTHPGLWEVSVIPENVNALNFWRNAVSKFSHGDYLEKICRVTYDAHQPNRYILSFQAT